MNNGTAPNQPASISIPLPRLIQAIVIALEIVGVEVSSPVGGQCFFFSQLIFIYHYTAFEDQIAAVGGLWFFPSTYFLFTIYTGFEDQIAAFVDAEVARTLATAERQSNIFYLLWLFK
jgi:hypothetical protein